MLGHALAEVPEIEARCNRVERDEQEHDEAKPDVEEFEADYEGDDIDRDAGNESGPPASAATASAIL